MKTQAPLILKRHVWPGGCTAMAIVRYSEREFVIREMGWCQSIHPTYSAALAAFNARISNKVTGA